jgi:hypothetical protein
MRLRSGRLLGVGFHLRRYHSRQWVFFGDRGGIKSGGLESNFGRGYSVGDRVIPKMGDIETSR